MKPLSIETSRLNIRWLDSADASFIHRLVNDPDWIRFIGDKSVSTLDDARNYIETGPEKMYREYGFGLNRVGLKIDDTPIGICGLLKRDSLENPDIGFAFLPEYRKMGFAQEAARAILKHGYTALEIPLVVAIIAPENSASRSLLGKLGFSFEGNFQKEPAAGILDLYKIDFKVDMIKQ